MEQALRGDMQTLRGDMRTQRGEMQCMGLSLQAGLGEVREEMRAMDWKMAPARGGMIESRGSVEVCQSAMETGEVGMTSDATIIDGETETNKHEGTTENFSETQEIEEIEGELYETKD